MNLYFGLDTGSTRNASALVGVHEADRIWTIICAARWQGSSEKPLDHRLIVGPEAAKIVKSFGGTGWAIDAFEQGPIKIVSELEEFRLDVRVQSGELADVYKHGKAVIHGERLQFAGDLDPVLVEDIKKGFCRVQGEHRGGKVKVWLPEDGTSHFDLTSAALRAFWLGNAYHEEVESDEPRPVIISTRSEAYMQPMPTRSNRDPWVSPRR